MLKKATLLSAVFFLALQGIFAHSLFLEPLGTKTFALRTTRSTNFVRPAQLPESNVQPLENNSVTAPNYFSKQQSVQAELQDTVIFALSERRRKLEDTTFSIHSKLDPDNLDDTKFTFTGIWDFPEDLTAAPTLGYTITGVAQFFPAMKGKLTVDSIAALIYKISAWPDVQGGLIVYPVLLPPKYGNLSNLTTGIKIAQQDLEPMPGVDIFNITADQINNSLVGNNGPNNVIVNTGGFVVPENRSFGFLFIRENPLDTMRFLGGFEWELAPNKTFGSMIRTNKGFDTVETFFSALQHGGPTIQAEYPSLNNQGVRQNFSMAVAGRFEKAASDVRPDPASGDQSLTLEANYPNPASDETHIRFSTGSFSTVTLRLTNVLGETIREIKQQSGAGSYVWDLKTADIPTGRYFYTLTAGTSTLTRSMTIIR